MSTRLKSLIIAIQFSALLWVTVIGGSGWLLSKLTGDLDPIQTASTR